MTRPKGKLLIIKVYGVSCGLCHEHDSTEHAHNWKEAAEIMRGLGWKATSLYGWICLDCAEKRQVKQ